MNFHAAKPCTTLPTPRPASVLILEDEGLVSMMIEDLVRDVGAGDIHVFAAAGEAALAVETGLYDCAILDVLLRDGTSMPVADALDRRGIPFIFTSGAGVEAVDVRHRGRPMVSKPFSDSALKAVILDILGVGAPELSAA